MIRFCLIVLSICFCTSAWATEVEVGYAGALYNFMHEGDLSAKFSLSELKGKDHVYALGAVENLKGEIQIFDGVPEITFAKNGEVSFDNTFERNATLIVYSQVTSWQDVVIPDEIVTRSQFENYLKMAASEHGIDIEKPVPFLIVGKTKFIDWHVIDWDPSDKVHTHIKHTNSGPHGRIEDTEVMILGFYSNKHRAIFTHHESDLHMHFITEGKTLAGHIDNLELGPEMVLKLPEAGQ
jgi:acetolactate decarboxylase